MEFCYIDWSNILSAFIGGVFVIVVFWLQIRSDRKVRHKEKLDHSYAIIEYLKTSLGSTEKTLDLYITELKKFVHAIQQNPILLPDVVYYSFPHSTRLGKKIDQNDVFNALCALLSLNDATALFKKIYSVVDSTNEIAANIRTDQNRGVTTNYSFRNDYKETIDLCMDRVYTTALASKDSQVKHQLITILSDFSMGQPKPDMPYTQTHLIEKLQEYIISRGIPDKTADLVELTIIGRRATMQFQQIKGHNLSITVSISVNIGELEKIQAVLVHVLLELGKIKQDADHTTIPFQPFRDSYGDGSG